MRVRVIRRVGLYAVIPLASLTLGIGVMHLPAARPLLVWLEALCPVAAVSPVQVELMQANAIASLVGVDSAPSEKPFGLRLISGSARDVSAWTSQRSFTCETVTRGFRYVWCTHVPASALGRVSVDAAHDREVVFALNREGRPIGVDILARTTPGGASVALVGAVMDELRRSLGDPHEAHGSFDAVSLDGPFRTAAINYRYTDYIVSLTATNIPGEGMVVREQYLVGNGLKRAD